MKIRNSFSFILILFINFSFSQICAFTENKDLDEQLRKHLFVPESLSDYSIDSKNYYLNKNYAFQNPNNKIDGEEAQKLYRKQIAHNKSKQAIKKILSLYGASPRIILQERENIGNAFALTQDDIDYIIYDIEFIFGLGKEFLNDLDSPSTISSKKYDDETYINLAILAHEIGHHVNNHTLNSFSISLEEKRLMELEADKFMGFILQRLGANLDEAKLAIKKYVKYEKDDTYSTHPALSKRLNYIEKGFNQSIEAKGDYELPFTKEEYYRLALQDMIDNKYYAAIDKLSLSIALYKKEPTDQDVGLLRVYATRAQAVEELEDYTSAINDYDFIIKRDEFNVDALRGKARCLYKIKEYEKSAKNYSLVLSIYDSLINGAFLNNNFKLTSLEEAITTKTMTSYYFANSIKLSNKLEQAKSIYEELIGWVESYKFPNQYETNVYSEEFKINTNVLTNVRKNDFYWYITSISELADIYNPLLKNNEEHHDLKKSINNYEKIVNTIFEYNLLDKLEANGSKWVEESYSFAVMQYGNLLLKQRKYNEAESIYKKVFSQNPIIYAAWGIAEVYYEKKEYDKALSQYEYVLKLYEKDEEKHSNFNIQFILNRLSSLSFTFKEYERALDYNTYIIEKSPLNYIYYWTRGSVAINVFKATQDNKYLYKALSDILFALNLDELNNYYEVLRDLARVKYFINDVEGYKNEVDKILELHNNAKLKFVSPSIKDSEFKKFLNNKDYIFNL
tara:strand:+ start:3046 stop:5253 length:2208 start_codon:yes stop_codon:yes gene_type:complete